MDVIKMNRRPKRHTLSTRMLVFLVLLAVLVVLGGIFGFYVFGGAMPGDLQASNGDGPFVQSPLSPAQVNALQHLSTYMQYKQLASLYVARMTLDEELGQ